MTQASWPGAGPFRRTARAVRSYSCLVLTVPCEGRHVCLLHRLGAGCHAVAKRQLPDETKTPETTTALAPIPGPARSLTKRQGETALSPKVIRGTENDNKDSVTFRCRENSAGLPLSISTANSGSERP